MKEPLNCKHGIQKVKVAINEHGLTLLQSYPHDDAVKRTLSHWYTSRPRFDVDQILSIELMSAPKEHKPEVQAWAVLEVARGDRLLAHFVREHLGHPTEIWMGEDGETFSIECGPCGDELVLQRCSLVGWPANLTFAQDDVTL